MARDLRDVPLLAHTHGQPATPTTMGKELAVLRLAARSASSARIDDAEYLGKFNGATGTFGAHVAAVPDADWPDVSPRVRRAPRPQLEPAHHPDRERTTGRPSCTPTSPASTGCCTTCAPTSGPTSRWATSRRSAADGTVGSSTMPHKINPIRFENAEANLEVEPPCSTSLAATLVHEPPAARPHRLLDAAQHRRRPSGTRCSPSTTPPAGSTSLDAVPATWPPTSTPTGRCSARPSSR